MRRKINNENRWRMYTFMLDFRLYKPYIKIEIKPKEEEEDEEEEEEEGGTS